MLSEYEENLRNERTMYAAFLVLSMCNGLINQYPIRKDLFYRIVLVLALGHDLLRIIFSMIKYKTALTFTRMIGAGNNNNNKLYKNIHNNKARLKGISLSIHNVERNWYFGLLRS